MLSKFFNRPLTRNALLCGIEKYLFFDLIVFKNRDVNYKLREQQYLMLKAFITSIKMAYQRKIAESYRKILPKILTDNILLKGIKARKNYIEKYNMRPPGFITISPTNACNLKCIGCYAAAKDAKKSFESLDFDVFDKIIEQNKKCFGSYFVVISGGEPFLYRDKKKKKDIYDIFRKHRDTLFLVYTNGLLLDEENVKKLAKLGNVSPAISVEGLEKETDYRRGEGVFKKILKVMENLKEAGVPFGISVTPTRKNFDVVFSDKFFKFWFKEIGALYAWLFQYLAQGRNPDMNLMLTPEQRLKSYKDVWKRIEKGYFIADFWNCGTVTRGCMAAGREGCGYFHILWNGDIEACVFAKIKDKNPKLNNVYNLFKNKLNLADAINCDLFREIRKRHENFRKNLRNELTPCLTRDNSEETLRIIKKTHAIITDPGIKKLMERGELQRYGDKSRELLNGEWEELSKK